MWLKNANSSSMMTNIKQSVGLTLYGMGLDHRIPLTGYNTDRQGLIFFTRPQLNLSSENIRPVRELSVLLGGDTKSISTWVRNTLDPRQNVKELAPLIGGRTSALINNTYGFIPALSNLCLRMSGWPSRAVSLYTSSPGKLREVYMQVDGRSRLEGPVNLTLEFARIPGDPVSFLLDTWAVYPEYVYEGLMFPYADLVMSRELDYNIRIFRFIMDINGLKINRVGSTLPGIIMSSGDGSVFDFDRTKGTPGDSNTVSVPMTFPAVVQNDPAILLDFNQIAEMFKPKLKEERREKEMKKIAMRYRGYFKGYLYPYIDLMNNHLESWTEPKIFNVIGKRLLDRGIISKPKELEHELLKDAR